MSSDMEAELSKLALSLQPTPAAEELRSHAMEMFNRVIHRRFGVRGRAFGSSVNGLQLQASDIDISVMLPKTVQEELIAEAIKQRDEQVRIAREASETESASVAEAASATLDF